MGQRLTCPVSLAMGIREMGEGWVEGWMGCRVGYEGGVEDGVEVAVEGGVEGEGGFKKKDVVVG